MAKHLDLVCLDNSQIEAFEKSSVFQDSKELVAHTLTSEFGDHRAYLFNGPVDQIPKEIDPRLFLHLSVDEHNCVGIIGQWADAAAKHFDVQIIGSMSFIIDGIEDEDLFLRLNEVCNGTLYQKNKEIIESIAATSGMTVGALLEATESIANGDDEMIDQDDDLVDEDDDILKTKSPALNCFERLEAILPNHSQYEDLDYFISNLRRSYLFSILGASTEEHTIEDEIQGIICSLNSTCSISLYLASLEFIKDEIFDLGEDFRVASSLWTEGTSNEDLYEEYDINNGEYVSYPTIHIKKYQAEPETIGWYEG
jgi:hypothetical protein